MTKDTELELKIGKYTISTLQDGTLWLEKDTEEGTQTSKDKLAPFLKAKLEQALDEFWDDEF